MARYDSYFARGRGAASVERFLLARQERQMTADARGYMGEHWTLPYNCGPAEAAADNLRERTDEQTEIDGGETDNGGEVSAFDNEE
jgi:hypothetical protein